MSVHSLIKECEFLQQKISGDLNIATLRVFLSVAVRGTCTQKDVEEELGISNASCSRNVSYWCDVKYDRTKGWNYIARVEDKADRRFKSLTLTKKGKAFYEALSEVAPTLKALASAKVAAAKLLDGNSKVDGHDNSRGI